MGDGDAAEGGESAIGVPRVCCAPARDCIDSVAVNTSDLRTPTERIRSVGPEVRRQRKGQGSVTGTYHTTGHGSRWRQFAFSDMLRGAFPVARARHTAGARRTAPRPINRVRRKPNHASNATSSPRAWPLDAQSIPRTSRGQGISHHAPGNSRHTHSDVRRSGVSHWDPKCA